MKYLRGLLYGFVTVGLYLLIPLLGWGLDDLAGFFSFGPRATYATAVGGFGLAVGIQGISGPEGIRGSRGEEGKLVGREHVIRVVLVLVLYITLFLVPCSDRRNWLVFSIYPVLPWIGAFLCGVGYALVFLSGLDLGRQYSQEVTIQKDHQLITTGIFRSIRNPRYLGLICAAVGLTLLFRSWIALAVCAILVPGLLIRIHDEEILLQKEFGPAWEAYRRRSWRLIPFIF